MPKSTIQIEWAGFALSETLIDETRFTQSVGKLEVIVVELTLDRGPWPELVSNWDGFPLLGGWFSMGEPIHGPNQPENPHLAQ